MAAPPPTFWTSSNNAKIIISRVKKLMLSFNPPRSRSPGKAAVETEAAPSLTAPPSTSMPPPPPVGLFQTPSSAGPIAPRSSDPAEEITPFSGIRDYLPSGKQRAQTCAPGTSQCSRCFEAGCHGCACFWFPQLVWCRQCFSASDSTRNGQCRRKFSCVLCTRCRAKLGVRIVQRAGISPHCEWCCDGVEAPGSCFTFPWNQAVQRHRRIGGT